ncbi:MAG: methyltransferase domain-containing protein [Myxococcota bacterium]
MTWEDAWAEGRTRWDAGAPAPALEALLAEGALGSGAGRRALVPGCGSGYDVFALARAGFEAVGLDLAPTAAARFETLRAEAGLDGASIAVGDAFAHAPAAPYDVVWDYTFCCALDPAERPRWAALMERLLAPEGVLATLVFPAIHAPSDYQGPPWPLWPDDQRAVLEPLGLRLTRLEAVTKSHPGREGKEHLALWHR